MKRILSFFVLAFASMALMADPVTGTSTENMADQGNPFTNGYNYSFSAADGEVTISFTALDSYEGLVAYLWNYTSGFAEKQMAVTGQTATIVLHEQAAGKVLDFACKFAYAGGMSVTKRFQYTVPAYEGGGQGSGEPTIYWSDFLGDGAGDGLYSNKYKVQDVDGVSVVNIQQPGWSGVTGPGIYITFPSAVSSVSSPAAIDGAGILLYLSGLMAEYTKVIVNCADGATYTFQVYYVDGEKGTTAISPVTMQGETELGEPQKILYNGRILIRQSAEIYDMMGRKVQIF